MRILSIRRQPPGGKVIARFDVELDRGVRAFDLKLTEGPHGWRVYAPAINGGAAVTFPPAVVDKLSALALEALADDKSSH